LEALMGDLLDTLDTAQRDGVCRLLRDMAMGHVQLERIFWQSAFAAAGETVDPDEYDLAELLDSIVEDADGG